MRQGNDAMTNSNLEPRLAQELRAALDSGLASGKLQSQTQVDQHTGLFRDRFGPAALRATDGEQLLRLMHGREDKQSRCLAYWLEFKNDEEFPGNRYGGIGGGSSMKFGIFQRQADNAWMGGSHTAPHVLSLQEAVEIARSQRSELLAGADVLDNFDSTNVSDEAYAQLQTAMQAAAPELSGDGWAHKYWSLLYPDRLDDYHNPRYQRFHLLKMLQMPPDAIGILDGGAARFNCAGKFVSIARSLGAPVNALTTVLNERDGAIRRYWRVGTKAGDTGESQWGAMSGGGFVSIGWRERVPDLSQVIGEEKASARNQIREWLAPGYPEKLGTASRKAGEILNFASEMAENDLVLACDGQTVLGVGRVRAAYEYDGQLAFPHKRRVEWLVLDPWQMPHPEGLRTTVFEIGRHAANLLELEQRLFNRGPLPKKDAPAPSASAKIQDSNPEPLDPLTARIEAVLQRKGQVILYGPPGTGKTYTALNAAKEFASRRTFQKSFSQLGQAERLEIQGPADGTGLVRLCTFHPGYGYEDFIEGLRPKTINGQMVFEARDGIFKRLCADATANPGKSYFLVVDEINRGDVPRIFGELITVIEHDKRGTAIMLPITGSSFSVPRNVFILGTMNTADRSISLLDTALRRRFGFVELMPDGSVLKQRKAGALPLGLWLDALNARLRQHLKRDARNLQIGHAYLLPSQPITSVAEFARVLRDDIIPLVEEYCYDDFNTLKDIFGTTLIDAEAGLIRGELFESTREEDLVQAIWFEEMQPAILTDEDTEPSHAEDEVEESDGDESAA
jgi:5-methylcytosine-specific restriction enzyme B